MLLGECAAGCDLDELVDFEYFSGAQKDSPPGKRFCDAEVLAEAQHS
jgi:hypothetical protein